MKTALGYETNAAPRFNEQLGYTYDAAGNLNFRTNNAFVQTFNNNSLNELTTVTRTGTLTVSGNTSTAATNVTVNGLAADRYSDLTYARTNFPLVDATTNFTAIAQSPLGFSDTNTVTVDLRATNTFVYDLNGNLRTNGNQILEYDDENRLVTNYVAAAWKSEFVYDGANRCRVQRDYSWIGGAWNKTNETRFVYDGVTVIQERDTSNAPLIGYTGNGSRLLARTDHVASTHAYYHTDGNRNITVLINGNGLIVAKYLYDPYGNTLAISGPAAEANGYRFASQRYHANSGLVLYLRRAYSPNLQRFLNSDPIGETGGQNLFAFVRNNPVSLSDFLGLSPNFDFQSLFPGFGSDPCSPIIFSEASGLPFDWPASAEDILRAEAMADYLSYFDAASIREDEYLKRELLGIALDTIMYGALGEFALGIRGGLAGVQSTEAGLLGFRTTSLYRETVNSLWTRDMGILARQINSSEPMIAIIGSQRDTAKFLGRPGFNVLKLSDAVYNEMSPSQFDRINGLWANAAYQRDRVWAATNPESLAAALKGRTDRSRFLSLELPMAKEFEVNIQLAPVNFQLGAH